MESADIITILRAGIAAAYHWSLSPDVRITEIPPERHNWYIPIAMGHMDPSKNEERIELEHFLTKNGGIWLGYGPRSKFLLFSRELPLDNGEQV